jgi:hypothetical protein
MVAVSKCPRHPSSEPGHWAHLEAARFPAYVILELEWPGNVAPHAAAGQGSA